MPWVKRGLIFAPSGQFGWINSHAQMPVGLVRGDTLRIYFSTRPSVGLSLPAFIDVDVNDPSRVLQISRQPVLDLGSPGSFDEHGIMPTMVIQNGNDILLYYTGWSRLAGRAPYNNSSGVAISRDGGETFERLFPGPILSRTAVEPLSATLSWVVREDSRWHMWYSTGTEWVPGDRGLDPVYLICQASSRDGLNWIRDGKPIIPQQYAQEAQSRPSLLYCDGRWHMWFSHRGSQQFRDGAAAYRMGYAQSTDLRTWHRNDELSGIDVSKSGWDSTMVAYPFVLRLHASTVMFYNGNGFGASGFGYAIWEG